MTVYDPSTSAGRVRLLINDTDTDDPVFDTDEIAAFLAMEGDDVRLAAASALDVLASNEAMVQKRIRLLDLQTDGPAVAKALRDHAGVLRGQVDEAGDFEIAEMVHDDFSWRERIEKQYLRGEL